MGVFEETVRNALLQPRKAIKDRKRAAKPKQVSKGKNVAAGTKRTIGEGEASQGKKTKLSHDENLSVNQSEDDK